MYSWNAHELSHCANTMQQKKHKHSIYQKLSLIPVFSVCSYGIIQLSKIFRNYTEVCSAVNNLLNVLTVLPPQ